VDRANRLIAVGIRVEALFLEVLHDGWSTAFLRGNIERALAESLVNLNSVTWNA